MVRSRLPRLSSGRGPLPSSRRNDAPVDDAVQALNAPVDDAVHVDDDRPVGATTPLSTMPSRRSTLLSYDDLSTAHRSLTSWQRLRVRFDSPLRLGPRALPYRRFTQISITPSMRVKPLSTMAVQAAQRPCRMMTPDAPRSLTSWQPFRGGSIPPSTRPSRAAASRPFSTLARPITLCIDAGPVRWLNMNRRQ